jgi:hypothetical protein
MRRFQYAILLLLALVALWSAGDIDYLNQFAQADLQYYRKMAQAAPYLALDIRPPFVFRIFAPFLAGILPFPDPLSFRLLTSIFLCASPLLLMRFLKKRGITNDTAFLLSACYVFHPYAFALNAFNYFQLCDVLIFIVVLLAFNWIPKEGGKDNMTLGFKMGENIGYFVLLLCLGVLVRETTLLIMATFMFSAVWASKNIGFKNKSEILHQWKYILPVIAIFLFSRIVIQSTVESDWSFLKGAENYAPKALKFETWFRLVVNAFVPFGFVPVLFWAETKAYFKTSPEILFFGVLVLVSCFFGADTERLVIPFLPFFYLIIGQIMDEFVLRNAIKKYEWLLFVFAIILANQHHIFARFPLPNAKWTYSVSLISSLLVCLLFLRHKKASTSSHAEAL